MSIIEFLWNAPDQIWPKSAYKDSSDCMETHRPIRTRQYNTTKYTWNLIISLNIHGICPSSNWPGVSLKMHLLTKSYQNLLINIHVIVRKVPFDREYNINVGQKLQRCLESIKLKCKIKLCIAQTEEDIVIHKFYS